eukprot:CAMPEP_0196727360 /NCGR_PEP_ID=MMETSP1091-20130531/8358_1 /TAXON_ID=302021 /ORGANISM="Rhodomonas sp., Strain CCMP768" /LENGTH=96 /DNA_ID=CAMNT_0042069927 /DNA_START=229 /DNA_END=519 /DNA_ORIENTATION=-
MVRGSGLRFARKRGSEASGSASAAHGSAAGLSDYSSEEDVAPGRILVPTASVLGLDLARASHAVNGIRDSLDTCTTGESIGVSHTRRNGGVRLMVP